MGDEGKGKIETSCPQIFMQLAISRGHNAGHTLIVNGKKLILHLLPSSICKKDAFADWQRCGSFTQ